MSTPNVSNSTQSSSFFARFEGLGSTCKKVFEIVLGYLQRMRETYLAWIKLDWRVRVAVPAADLDIELVSKVLPEENKPRSWKETLILIFQTLISGFTSLFWFKSTS